jgi:RNA polymerase sigma-70 factor (ECF subfamily)
MNGVDDNGRPVRQTEGGPANAAGPTCTAACSAELDTDARIERALARGDYRAVIELCATRYGDVIGRLCLALVGVHADAERLVEEVLLAAYDSAPNHRGKTSLRGWLFGIARSKCAKHLESRARHDVKPRSLPAPAANRNDGDTSQPAHRARAALAAVKPSEREALVLRFSADLTFQEIAAAIRTDDATARQRVSRGLARLQGAVAQQPEEER